MSITKQERYSAEIDIFNQRGDGGVRAVHQWLKIRREELNRQWPSVAGDELAAMQGEAKSIDKLIQVIERGPSMRTAVPELETKS